MNGHPVQQFILVPQAKYLNLISVLSFETWVGLFIAYPVVTLAAIFISYMEVGSGFTKSQKWRRTIGMPFYTLGTLFPQDQSRNIIFGHPSISILSIFWGTFSLFIFLNFNSNLLARLMAVGKNYIDPHYLPF